MIELPQKKPSDLFSLAVSEGEPGEGIFAGRKPAYRRFFMGGEKGSPVHFDANGNCTSDGVRTFSWDAENRLVSIVQGTHESDFVYDGLSRRVEIVEKENGNVTGDKKFVWSRTEICEERDSTGAIVNKRFFQQGEQIGGNSYFYSRDYLGSIREMTDSSGAIRARYDFDPFGRQTKITGDLDSDFGFTGFYFHGLSGLNLTLYRLYDPNTGRWFSRDPLEENGGLNLYEYVSDDPVLRVDPLGLTVYVCSRKTSFGIGNHTYFYDDSASAGDCQSCGTTGCSAGGTSPCSNKEKGPPGGDVCQPIPGSDGNKGKSIMDCCKNSANNGPYCPKLNDCHTALDNCLKKNGINPPDNPRLGPPHVGPITPQ